MSKRIDSGKDPGAAVFLPLLQAASGPQAHPPGSSGIQPTQLPPAHGRGKNCGRVPVKREPSLVRDALFIVRRNGQHHVIAESYFYKTEPYYTILTLENEGKQVRPASSAVLDAYVVPVCLERVKMSGVPVCEWGISQAYVPLPAILYGLNYFATSAEYTIVTDNDTAKNTIRHITNNGKYPFCFQKFAEGSEVRTCTAIFGKTVGACTSVAAYTKIIYDLFSIPLLRTVWIRTGDSYALSSLGPLHYSELSDAERSLLSAYLSSQEFL